MLPLIITLISLLMLSPMSNDHAGEGRHAESWLWSVHGVNAETNDYITRLTTVDECVTALSLSGDSARGIVYVACFGSPTAVIAIQGSIVTRLANSTHCPGDYRYVYADPINDIVYATCYTAAYDDSAVLAIHRSTGEVVTIANSTQCPHPMAIHKDVKRGRVVAACDCRTVVASLRSRERRSLV